MESKTDNNKSTATTFQKRFSLGPSLVDPELLRIVDYRVDFASTLVKQCVAGPVEIDAGQRAIAGIAEPPQFEHPGEAA